MLKSYKGWGLILIPQRKHPIKFWNLYPFVIKSKHYMLLFCLCSTLKCTKLSYLTSSAILSILTTQGYLSMFTKSCRRIQNSIFIVFWSKRNSCKPVSDNKLLWSSQETKCTKTLSSTGFTSRTAKCTNSYNMTFLSNELSMQTFLVFSIFFKKTAGERALQYRQELKFMSVSTWT